MELFEEHKKDVQFYVVYIREAHAIDSPWPMGGKNRPIVEDPSTWEERAGVAKVCMAKLELEGIPSLIDDIDDSVNDAYEAWPDRLYLVGRDGKLAYRGGEGPRGFKPDELEEAIVTELAKKKAKKDAKEKR